MLERYDYRLAEFAQTLSDALNQTLPARITAAISGTTPTESSTALESPDHSSVVRVLELAREQTAADAAVAIVGTREDPILATVGLSQAEVNQVGGLGVPDYRGARAIQVSFSSDEGSGATPIRGGLAVPLMDSSTDPGMLAVLTRTPDRRFSEIDITSLENVLTVSRPTLETSLELKAPDPVPERDPLTDLYDRPAFHALLDLEIGRARGRREQMALLMLDVDRLTTINARIGHLAADDVLATHREGPPGRRRAARHRRAGSAAGGSASSSRRPTAATRKGSSSGCRRRSGSGRCRTSASCRSPAASPSCSRTTTRQRSSCARTPRSGSRRARVATWS